MVRQLGNVSKFVKISILTEYLGLIQMKRTTILMFNLTQALTTKGFATLSKHFITLTLNDM